MKSDAVPHSLTIGHAGTIGSATRSSSIGFFHAGLVEAIMKTPFDDLTVLVVEDDWFAREDIAHAFRQEGGGCWLQRRARGSSSFFARPAASIFLSPILI
jgi:hypothetical protein